MEDRVQMSETLPVGILLAMSGGFLDSYTYLVRGGVFANAETGNMVLLGVSLLERKFQMAVTYLIPILCFFAGVFVAEIIRHRFQSACAIHRRQIHWRHLILLLEAAVLAAVAYLPGEMNIFANSLVAFVCALQVESFRKVNGNPYATTMCTGNLRSAAENLYRYKNTKDRQMLKNALQYAAVICFFICGAAVGSVIARIFSYRSVWAAIGILALVGILMTKKKRKNS